ncbi:MAG TPA: MarP family serine protease [Candidatus Saccharimonadales bacterium]|nr:MarP family serine protease [Candidatus Saccharimonadales bacterium]
MFGCNWIDLVIIVLLAGVVAEGIRIGVLSQLFVIAGFFSVLFISGWFFPHVVRFDDLTLRTVINAALVLLSATYAAMRSFDLGQKIHWSFRQGKLQKNRGLETAETILGSLPGLAAGVMLVWLLGVMVGRLPFVGLSNSVNDARIMQELTRRMPPVPAVFAEFNGQINPNAQPYVFLQPRPQATFQYDPAAVQAAAGKATASVVRITSFSCGGVAAGSGFVVAPALVATNAHVVAGSRRPIIKYGGNSYEGVPIYFDAGLDLALLRVQGLTAAPLELAPRNVALDTTVAVLGYPGGNYRVAPGIIRDTRATAGASIYDQGNFGRGIYLVQGQVDPGSSGGPIVMQNGRVAGIVFSKSTDVPNVAYALTSVHIGDALRQAGTSHRRVGTGACMAE